MKIIEAKVLDPTHLELSEPISAKSGQRIDISLSDEENDLVWREAARRNFLKACDDGDAIYDEL